jgi:preprotein translocase subunit SecG
MFFTFITIIHVLVCLVIIGVVLLQQGKGASMGAAFGTAGSQTVFGSSGAGNFLTRVTAVCAAIFFTTSIILAFRTNFRRSVVEGAAPIEESSSSSDKPAEKGADKAPDKAADKPADKSPDKQGSPAAAGSKQAPVPAAPAPSPAK